MLELFKDIIKLLPEEIKNEELTAEFLKASEELLIKGGKILTQSILLSEEIYSQLIAQGYSKDLINKSNSQNTLFYIINYKNCILSFKSSDKNDRLLITLTSSLDSKSKEKRITVRKDRVIVETTVKETKNDFINNYSFDIQLFDKLGRELTIPNKEKLLINDFSEKFGIPLNKSEYYMKNFIQEAKNINKFLLLNNQIGDEEIMDTFKPPFAINDLEVYMYTQMNEENILDDEPKETIDTSKLPHMLDQFTSQVIAAIGNEGTIILSPALYDSISLYLCGILKSIQYFEGYIIKKGLDGSLTLYKLMNLNGVLFIVNANIPEEKIKQLYYRVPGNQYLDYLTDFFNINRRRK